jgi:hypothetical protein
LISLVWDESGGGVGAFSVSWAAWAKEKTLRDGGDGGVILRDPDAGLAAGIVADGYGDIAHGCLPWIGRILDDWFHCAPRDRNYMQTTCDGAGGEVGVVEVRGFPCLKIEISGTGTRRLWLIGIRSSVV